MYIKLCPDTMQCKRNEGFILHKGAENGEILKPILEKNAKTDKKERQLCHQIIPKKIVHSFAM